MTFIDAYLTPKQRTIWRLRFNGNNQTEISRRTGVTRQTVNKTLGVIDSKVTRALLEAAKVNRIDVRRLEMEGGFLLGHSNVFDLDAMVTYSDENGIQVWYKGEGDCGKCDEYSSCKAALMREADVRGIELPEEVETLEPSRLADIVFNGLTG